MKKVMITTLMTFGLFTAGAQAGYTLEETQACGTNSDFQSCVVELQSRDSAVDLASASYTAEETRDCATASDFHTCVAHHRNA
uniref:hypothetical protein n=1 Tax=Thaumasiovibrio occultus TaxID=1891184 RepID=UPI000B34DF7C|nr:hypothetical protein [Thaumasiovibrio occultus]